MRTESEQHFGLDVRRYAAIAAYLRAAPLQRAEEILARNELTPSAWKAATEAWTRAIDEENERGEHELVLTYAREFGAAERRLARDPTLLEAPVPPRRAGGPGEPAQAGSTGSGEAASGLIPEPPPMPTKVPSSLAATAPIDIQAILAAGLPFAPSTASPAVAERSPRAVTASAGLTGTALDLGPMIAAAVLPFGGAASAPGSPPTPELTFEQYVALCAELTVRPGSTDQILAKAHVAASALPELHASWRRRLAGDADLTQRWHGLFAHYQAWFAKNA